MKMKIILKSLGVWSVIEGDDRNVDKDNGAMVAISQAIPDNVMMAIGGKETAKEVWEAIREMRIGEDRVKKARVQVLRRELNKLEMRETESVTEYSLRLTTLVGEIRSLGASLEEKEVVEKLFSSVSDRFLNIIGTIEQFGEMESMSVTEAIGRLRIFEEGFKGRRETSNGGGEQLLLTQEEWEARSALARSRDQVGVQRGGYQFRGRGSGGRGQGRGQGGFGTTNEEDRPRTIHRSRIRCYNCDELGHYARECPRPRKREIVNLTTTEDVGEPELLMAEVCMLNPSSQVVLNEGFEEQISWEEVMDQTSWFWDENSGSYMRVDETSMRCIALTDRDDEVTGKIEEQVVVSREVFSDDTIHVSEGACGLGVISTEISSMGNQLGGSSDGERVVEIHGGWVEELDETMGVHLDEDAHELGLCEPAACVQNSSQNFQQFLHNECPVRSVTKPSRSLTHHTPAAATWSASKPAKGVNSLVSKRIVRYDDATNSEETGREIVLGLENPMSHEKVKEEKAKRKKRKRGIGDNKDKTCKSVELPETYR